MNEFNTLGAICSILNAIANAENEESTNNEETTHKVFSENNEKHTAESNDEFCHCDCDCCNEFDDFEDDFMFESLKDAVKKVVFKNPHTIVFWNDGMITRVKASEGETYDPEKGFAMAAMKWMFGNSYFRHLTKLIKTYGVDYEVKPSKKKTGTKSTNTSATKKTAAKSATKKTATKKTATKKTNTDTKE